MRNSKKILNPNNDLSESAKTSQITNENAKIDEITARFSTKTKLIVYLACDTLIGVGLLIPMLAVVFDWNDSAKITALANAFSTAGGFGLVMFGILKGSKK